MKPKRGDIWLVNFDPTVGGEIKKTRPALVISNNHNNQYSLTVTLLPITDKGHDVYPFEVYLSKDTQGLSKESKIKCQQVRTVDKRRLIKLLGKIDEAVLDQVHEALNIILP